MIRNFESINRCRVDPKQNSIVQEYILPDLSTNRLGRIRQLGETVTDTDQILIMNNERFTVPELLFRPDDIGKYTSKRRRRVDSTLFFHLIDAIIILCRFGSGWIGFDDC